MRWAILWSALRRTYEKHLYELTKSSMLILRRKLQRMYERGSDKLTNGALTNVRSELQQAFEVRSCQLTKDGLTILRTKLRRTYEWRSDDLTERAAGDIRMALWRTPLWRTCYGARTKVCRTNLRTALRWLLSTSFRSALLQTYERRSYDFTDKSPTDVRTTLWRSYRVSCGGRTNGAVTNTALANMLRRSDKSMSLVQETPSRLFEKLVFCLIEIHSIPAKTREIVLIWMPREKIVANVGPIGHKKRKKNKKL